MITIFSNPRPFVGPFDLIQRNAVKSWLAHRRGEVILFDDEEHTASQVAREVGAVCVTDVACNEFGTPLLSDVFAQARSLARYEIMAQVNTDVILMSDFFEAVAAARRFLADRPFLLVGRRWNLEVDSPVGCDDPGWEDQLRGRVAREGRLHGMSGLDYWVFPRSLDLQPLDFAVGRPGMDTWLVFRARSLGIPVVDATAVITAVHQNHDHPLIRKSHFEVERQKNLRLAGGYSRMLTLRDADWLLTPQGLERPPYPRRVLADLSLFRPWRALLAAKRRLHDVWRRSASPPRRR